MPVRVKKGVTWEQSKTRIKEVINDITNGLTAAAVAEKHGLSRLTVIKICQQNKVPRSECAARRKAIHDRINSAVDEVRHGGLVEFVAAKYGYTQRSLEVLCSNYGVSVAGKWSGKKSIRSHGMTVDEVIKWVHSKCTQTDTGCLIWNGKVGDQGYASVNIRGKSFLIHRLVCEQHFGRKLVGEECALHKCDIRRCVSPFHLFIGTRKDNNDDKTFKKRNNSPRGESHGSAKMTTKEAREVIDLIKDGRMRLKDIADVYGVHPTTVSGIKSGRKWSYIPR